MVDTEVLKQRFDRLFTKGGLRTTEVAHILNVHRVTVSRWKHSPINCEDERMLLRINNLVKLVEMAIISGELPLDRYDVTGKYARLAALKEILLRHSRRRN